MRSDILIAMANFMEKARNCFHNYNPDTTQIPPTKHELNELIAELKFIKEQIITEYGEGEESALLKVVRKPEKHMGEWLGY